MPTPLLGAADYPEVRAALDTSLTAELLPDAILALPIYVPAGIADVLAIDPGAEARTGADGAAVHRAAVCFSAARLAVAAPAIQSEAFGDVTYDRGTVDYAARAATLRAIATAAIGAVAAVAGVGASAPLLVVAPAGRPLVGVNRTRWARW